MHVLYDRNHWARVRYYLWLAVWCYICAIIFRLKKNNSSVKIFDCMCVVMVHRNSLQMHFIFSLIWNFEKFHSSVSQLVSIINIYILRRRYWINNKVFTFVWPLFPWLRNLNIFTRQTSIDCLIKEQ